MLGSRKRDGIHQTSHWEKSRTRRTPQLRRSQLLQKTSTQAFDPKQYADDTLNQKPVGSIRENRDVRTGVPEGKRQTAWKASMLLQIRSSLQARKSQMLLQVFLFKKNKTKTPASQPSQHTGTDGVKVFKRRNRSSHRRDVKMGVDQDGAAAPCIKFNQRRWGRGSKRRKKSKLLPNQ